MSYFRTSGVVIQAEANECGLACLAMVSGRIGAGDTLGQLRQRFVVSSLGASAHDLVKWAQQLRMNAAACRVKMHQLARISTPCVLHFSNHWVVLKTVSSRHVTVLDPAKGERRLSESEFEKRYSGLALLFSGTEPQPQAGGLRHQLCSRLVTIPRFRTYLGLLAGSAVLTQLTALGVPTFISNTLDRGLGEGGPTLWLLLAVTMTLVGIHGFLEWLRTLAVIRTSESLSQQSACSVFEHMLQLKPGYYGRRQKSQLVERFRNVHRLSAALGDDIPNFLVSIVFAVLTLLALSVFAGAMAWVSVLAMTVVASLWWQFSKRIRRAQHEELLAREAEYAHLHETCVAIHDIKLADGAGRRAEAYHHVVTHWLSARSRKNKLAAAARICTSGVSNLAHCVLILVGVVGTGDAGSLSIGVLFIALALQGTLFSHVQAICERAQGLVCRVADLNLLGDILDAGREAVDKAKATRPRSCDDVGFIVSGVEVRRRGSLAPKLSALQLRVAPGEMLAITGANGAGKSTLADTLCGLREPQQGQMRINGRSPQLLGVAGWRAEFGVVRQGAALVDGSVLENVAFMVTYAERSRVRTLLQQVGLGEWLASQPCDIDTQLSADNPMLSTGERQRLLLARALYRCPSVLLLDEGTANLDASALEDVLAMIRRQGVMCIIISHQSAVLSAVDRVLELRGGKLREPVQLNAAAKVHHSLRSPATRKQRDD